MAPPGHASALTLGRRTGSRPKNEAIPPSIASSPPIAIPTWNALTDADSSAACTRGRTAGGAALASDTRVRFFAWVTACWTCGLSCAAGSFESIVLANCAAHTAPTAATASSPATRATALFTPEAMPEWWGGAPASTVAVSGATVSESPSPNTSTPGST